MPGTGNATKDIKHSVARNFRGPGITNLLSLLPREQKTVANHLRIRSGATGRLVFLKPNVLAQSEPNPPTDAMAKAPALATSALTCRIGPPTATFAVTSHSNF